MTWFSTKKNVSTKIDALLTDAELLLERVLLFYEQDKIVESLLGPNDLIFRINAECQAVYDRLIEAQTHIRFGMRSPRMVSITVDAAAKMLHDNQKLLTKIERARIRGVALANAHLGTK